MSSVPEPKAWAVGCSDGVLGGPGSVCLPSSVSPGKSDQQDFRSLLQESHSGSPGLVQHAVVFGSGSSSQIPICLPNQSSLVSQPFNRALHRDMVSLILHALFLELSQSKNKGSLRKLHQGLRLLREEAQPEAKPSTIDGLTYKTLIY